MPKNLIPWIGGAAILYGLYLVKGVLMPFMVGFFVAYAFNPIVAKITQLSIPRSLAAGLMIALFFLAIVGFLLIAIPFIHEEILLLVQQLPIYGDRFYQILKPWLEELQGTLPQAEWQKLHDLVTDYAGNAITWGLKLIANVLTNGLALANILSLLIITPIVSFYLLRDWPFIIQNLNRLLPKKHAGVIQQIAGQINSVLGQFVRGQSLVCLTLACYYAIGLIIVGLDFGGIVGIATGLLSFVPYVGALTGTLTGMGMAFAQFSDWHSIGFVAGVFLIGQGLEGYVLTPLFVGDRIGLHPVWIIFSLLAGASLFGLVGVLFAVPLAAVVGVLVRYSTQRYLEHQYVSNENYR